MQSNKPHLPLADFLEELKAQGFVVGVDTHLHVNQLLNRLGATSSIGQLKYALCPLFATNPEEQEKFYQIFDAYFVPTEPGKTVKSAGDGKTEGDEPPLPPIPPVKNKRLIYLLALVVAVIGIGVIWSLIPPAGDDPDKIEIEQEKLPDFDGDKIPDDKDPDDDNDNIPDSVDCAPKMANPNQLEGDGDCDGIPDATDLCPDLRSKNNSDSDNDGVGDICDNCPDRSNPLQQDDADCDGLLGDLDKCPDDPENRCLEKNIDRDQDGIADENDFCPDVADTLNLDSDRDFEGDVCDTIDQRKAGYIGLALVPEEIIAELRVDPEEAESIGFWAVYGQRGLLSLLVLLLAGYLAFEWYRLSRRKLFLERERRKGAPYTYNWNISQPEGFQLYHNKTFFEAGKQLRERQLAGASRLDINQTIKETVRSGGFSKLVFSDTTKQPEYLVLIEQSTDADHQTQLFHQLIKELQAQDIHLEVFYYEEDPRLCYRPGEQQRISLHELHVRYTDYRLLLFGAGHQLLSSLYGGFASWTEQLLDWEDRSILTPKPASEWGYREVTLAKQFVVLPASLKGVQLVADHFEQEIPSDLAYWYKRSQELPVPAEEDAVMLDQVEAYLGKDLFQWFCACAVYPEVSWDLFLHLGIELSDGAMLTEANLLKMVQLPWLRTGYISNDLRVALIARLSKPNNKIIRQALVDLLVNNQPEANSYAEDAHRMQLIVQQLALGLSGVEKRKALELLQDVPESEIERDYTVVKMLEGQYRSPLQFLIPQQFRKLFYRNGLPMLGMKPLARLALVACAALPLIIGFFSMPEAEWEYFRGQHYQVQSNEDWMWFNAFKGQVYYQEGMAQSSELLFDSAFYSFYSSQEEPVSKTLFYNETSFNWQLAAYQNERAIKKAISGATAMWINQEGTEGWIADDYGFLKLTAGHWARVQEQRYQESNRINDIWMNEAATAGWGVGDKGRVIQFSDGEWIERDDIKEEIDLNAIWISPDGNKGWAVGAGGTILEFRAWYWAVYQEYNVTSSNLQAIWVNSSQSNGWIVGGGGEIWQYSKGDWKKDSDASQLTSGSLNCIWMDESGSQGWAAGEDWAMVSFGDGSWKTGATLAQKLSGSFQDIWMNGDLSEGWMVGTNGEMVQYENGGWKELKRTGYISYETLQKITLINDGEEGWVAGTDGVKHFKQGQWSWSKESEYEQRGDWVGQLRSARAEAWRKRYPVFPVFFEKLDTINEHRPKEFNIGKFDIQEGYGYWIEEYKYNAAVRKFNQRDYKGAYSGFDFFVKADSIESLDSLRYFSAYYAFWAFHNQQAEYLEYWTDSSHAYVRDVNDLLNGYKKRQEVVAEAERYLKSIGGNTDRLGLAKEQQLKKLICRLAQDVNEDSLKVLYPNVHALCGTEVPSNIPLEIFAWSQQSEEDVRKRERDVRKTLEGYEINRFENLTDWNQFKVAMEEVNATVATQQLALLDPSRKNYIFYAKGCEKCQDEALRLAILLFDRFGLDSKTFSYNGSSEEPIKAFLGDFGPSTITIKYKYGYESTDADRVSKYLRNTEFWSGKRTQVIREKMEPTWMDSVVRTSRGVLVHYGDGLFLESNSVTKGLREEYNSTSEQWQDGINGFVRVSGGEYAFGLQPTEILVLYNNVAPREASVDEKIVFDEAEKLLLGYERSVSITPQQLSDMLIKLRLLEVEGATEPEKVEYYTFILKVLNDESEAAYKIIDNPNKKIGDDMYFDDPRLQFYVGQVLESLVEDEPSARNEAEAVYYNLLNDPKWGDSYKFQVENALKEGQAKWGQSSFNRKKPYGTTELRAGDLLLSDDKKEVYYDILVKKVDADKQQVQLDIDEYEQAASLIGSYKKTVDVGSEIELINDQYIGLFRLVRIEQKGLNPFVQTAIVDFEYPNYEAMSYALTFPDSAIKKKAITNGTEEEDGQQRQIDRVSTKPEIPEGQRELKVLIKDPYWNLENSDTRVELVGGICQYADEDYFECSMFINPGQTVEIHSIGENFTGMEKVRISITEYDYDPDTGEYSDEVNSESHNCDSQGGRGCVIKYTYYQK